MASFKESSELEFGADDAFMLTPSEYAGEVLLKHLKARHSQPRDIAMKFKGHCMQFEPVENWAAGDAARPSKGKLTAALANAWGHTEAAHDDDGSN